jgi:hypothetical protein
VPALKVKLVLFVVKVIGVDEPQVTVEALRFNVFVPAPNLIPLLVPEVPEVTA